MVLSLYLFERPHRSIAAGLSLALAINVKLIPIVLVPILVSHLSTMRERLQFLAVLAMGCSPIIVASVLIGQPFITNVLLYRPIIVKWGLHFFLWRWEHLASLYGRVGGSFIVASVVLLATLQFFRRVFTVAELATISVCLFLILAPGFGIQYLIYPAPLLVLVAPRWAAGFNVLAGAMAFSCYWSFLVPSWPLSTIHHRDLPVMTTRLGALTWLLLCLFVAKSLMTMRGTIARPNE
jgi:hypothetical protein